MATVKTHSRAPSYGTHLALSWERRSGKNSAFPAITHFCVKTIPFDALSPIGSYPTADVVVHDGTDGSRRFSAQRAESRALSAVAQNRITPRGESQKTKVFLE